jgi:hypothetical protein
MGRRLESLAFHSSWLSLWHPSSLSWFYISYSMLALAYPLFVTKHKIFISAMSIVTRTQLTGNTSLFRSPLYNRGFCWITFESVGNEKGWVSKLDTQPLNPGPRVSSLSYPEHLSPTYRTHTLGCWLAVLHGYALGIFHFSLGSTFHTVCLHLSNPLFVTKHKLFVSAMSIVSSHLLQLYRPSER